MEKRAEGEEHMKTEVEKGVFSPCIFERVEKGELFHCFMKIEDCGDNKTNPPECGEYYVLRKKLVSYIQQEIRVGCRCKQVEINGFWVRQEEVFVSQIKSIIPQDIWKKIWNSLPKVPCQRHQIER